MLKKTISFMSSPPPSPSSAHFPFYPNSNLVIDSASLDRVRFLSTSSSGTPPVGEAYTFQSREVLRRFDLESGMRAVLYKETHHSTPSEGEAAVKELFVLELSDSEDGVVNRIRYKRLLSEGDESDFILLPLSLTTYDPESGEPTSKLRLKTPDDLPNSIRSYFVLSETFSPVLAQKFVSNQPGKEGWFFEIIDTAKFEQVEYERQFFGVWNGAWYEFLDSPNLGNCLWPVSCLTKGGDHNLEWGIYRDTRAGVNRFIDLKEVEKGKPPGVYRRFLSTMMSYHNSSEWACYYLFSDVPLNFSWVSITANSKQFTIFKFSIMTASQRSCSTYKKVSEFKLKDPQTFAEMKAYLGSTTRVEKKDNPFPTELNSLFESIKSAK